MKISKYLCVLLCTTSLFNMSCSKKSVAPQSKIGLLGTVCSINAYDDGSEKLYTAIFNRLEEIDDDFNVNKSQSEISLINSNAGIAPVKVSEDVYYVVKTALQFSGLTKGAFDPTIGPVVALWGINTDHARIPEKNEIEQALRFVDYTKVILDDKGQTVYLTEKGMSIDLGGIAKGYACDEVVKILKHNKVKRAVVDLGGNVYVWGTKKDGSRWKVGVRNPESNAADPALALSLYNSTVVTSGVYERYFIQDGIRFHHIINPEDGYPCQNDLLSLTVVCESSIIADALSTSLFLLGQDKGFEFVEKLSQTNEFDFVPDVIYISKEHEVVASSNLRNSLTAVNENYKKISFR